MEASGGFRADSVRTRDQSVHASEVRRRFVFARSSLGTDAWLELLEERIGEKQLAAAGLKRLPFGALGVFARCKGAQRATRAPTADPGAYTPASLSVMFDTSSTES